MNNQKIKVAFLGDISLNGEYETFYRNGILPFKDINESLKDTIVVGNLECFARGTTGVNQLKNPNLSTNIKTLHYLNDLNLKIACIANNHVYDNLLDGFKITTSFLRENKIDYIGAGVDDDFKSKLIINDSGIKIGFLNYVTLDTNPKLPENPGIVLNYFDENAVKSEIEDIKNGIDHLVVCMHWGGKMEGSMYPDKDQRRIAKYLIDCGADLIIGHHSHTLQPIEIYKNKYIFYSLGDFCFSDLIINNKIIESDKKRTGNSIILKVCFYKEKYKISYQRIVNQNGFIVPIENISKLKQIKGVNILLYFSVFWRVYYFYEKVIYRIIAYFFSNGKNPFTQLKKLSFRKIASKIIDISQKK